MTQTPRAAEPCPRRPAGHELSWGPLCIHCGEDPNEERSPSAEARKSATAKGHAMLAAPGMAQGNDKRWDCSVCRCYVWVRQYGPPYGTALTAGCSALVGRGRVDCGRCSLSWEWPGSFADEAEAHAYVGRHACGAESAHVTVLAPSAAARTVPRSR